ncbi:hypothetical protein GQ42DRAFT_505 [Ramicandelaber brevisporus]|nr:hypothetical protein GQ42DRAFT_505 [Ramicandelaber brevisporus]
MTAASRTATTMVRQTATTSTTQLNTVSTAVDSEHVSKDTNVAVSVVGKRRYKRRGKLKCGRLPGQKPVHIPLCPKHCRQCNKGFKFLSEIVQHLNCKKHLKASEIDANKVDEARFNKQAGWFDENHQLKKDYMNQSATPDDINSYSAGSEDCPDCLELRDCTKSDCSNHVRVPKASPSSKRRRMNEPIPIDVNLQNEDSNRKAGA